MKEREIIEKYKTGDSFTATLSPDRIECSGVLYIDEKRGLVYFCQNETNGSDAPDKQGYKYSYVYSPYVKNLVITPKSTVINNYPIF